MKQQFIIIVAVIAALSLGGCEGSGEVSGSQQVEEKQASAVELAGNHIRLSPSSIVDHSGFGQPIVAATLFIPHGWQQQGGIAWGNQHACTNGYAFNWFAVSADESSGLAVVPQQAWEWNDRGQIGKPGCSLLQIESLEQYIQLVLPQVIPNAEITGFRPRPDLAQELASLNTENHTDFQSVVSQVSTGEAEFVFDKNGVTTRGIFVAAVNFTRIRTGGGQFSVMIHNLNGYALPAYIAYAPADKFDPAVFEAVRRSFLVNPAWESQIAQHNLVIDRQNREGIMARAKIHSDAMEDIARIQQQTWENQSKSSDYRAREFIEYVRDVETYNDSDQVGGQVQLSSAYDHAWKLDDGSYFLTNDSGFKPYRDLGIDGSTLSVSGN